MEEEIRAAERQDSAIESTKLGAAADRLLQTGQLVCETPSRSHPELRREREVLDAAIAKQDELVLEQRRAASREICNALKPEHQNLVKRILESLEELQSRLQAEEDFRMRLTRDGVTFDSPLAAVKLLPSTNLARAIKQIRPDRSRERMRQFGYKV